MDDSAHDAVALHLAELLDEHLLGDAGDCAFELGEAEDVASEELEEDGEFPAPFQKFKGFGNTLRGRQRRQIPFLTFWCVPYLFVCSCHRVSLDLVSGCRDQGRAIHGLSA